MADSIYPANLPAGYDAYLGYVDGHWSTCSSIKAKFPGKQFVCLTVTGATLDADGCDIETGDLDPTSGADWLGNKVRSGYARPVCYASVSLMTSVIGEFGEAGINRSQVRLLSAHYGVGQHICGPGTCGQIAFPMDGTQWTNTASGVGSSQIDASILSNDFFTGVGMQEATVKLQDGITLCSKCRGLYYGPEAGISQCPAGGQHAPANAVSFNILYSE